MHEATKVSPSYMMLGREITLPIDLMFGEVQQKKTQYNLKFLDSDHLEQLNCSPSIKQVEWGYRYPL